MSVKIFGDVLREDAKKCSSLNGRAIKVKRTYLGTFFPSVPTAIKLKEDGGGVRP